MFGSSAWTRSIRPPPSRVAGTSRPFENRTGTPVVTSADLISDTVQSGCRCIRSAAAPATCGAARLVPLALSQSPSDAGTDDRTPTPGAVTSGLNCSEYGVGPPEEKEAMRSGVGELCPPVDAATAIAFAALAGEVIEPLPKSSKSLPAAIAERTPASAAALSARTTGSRRGSTSGSPSDMLITFMPSFTAASIAAASSGALPSSPTSGVAAAIAL